MKCRTVLLSITAVALAANTACEQQTYEETKKFNQHVPGAHAGEHGAGKAGHEAVKEVHPEKK